MAFDLGMHWSLDDTNTLIDPLIIGMALKIPVGKNEGTFYNMIPAHPSAVDNFEFDIFDRSVNSKTGVVGDGVGTGWADGTTTTDLPMASAAIGVLTIGDIMEVESEQVIVSDVDRSAYTIDVVARGHGSTSGAAHVDTTAFTVIGSAINPTDLKNVESFAENTGKWTNYCQRFVATIDQEFDDQLQARKTFEQKPQLIMEAMNRIAKGLYSTSIKGVKSAKTKTSPYTTAGVLEQLTNSTGRKRTALTYDATSVTSPITVVQESLKTCWAAGGNPTHILLAPANLRKFNPLMEQFKNGVAQKSGVVGTDNATSFFYEGSELTFISDKDMPTTSIAIVTLPQITKGWRAGDVLRGPVEEPRDSTLELRYSMYGSWFLQVLGVGVDHIVATTVSL